MRVFVRRGFTLLELVVASALVAVMGMAVVALAGRGLTVWQRTDAQLQQTLQMEKALQQLAGDLRNAVAISDQAFVGDTAGLVFFRDEEAGRLVRLNYRLEESGGERILLREEQSYPAAENKAGETKTALDRVRVFSLEYASLEERDGQKALIWVPAWSASQQTTAVPELVRITVGCNDPKGGVLSLTREVWIPHGTLTASPHE